jgi:hypothetical protein
VLVNAYFLAIDEIYSRSATERGVFDVEDGDRCRLRDPTVCTAGEQELTF